MASESVDVTNMLLAWEGGDEASRDRLLDMVHGELRRLAAAQMRGEARHLTLQPTALVHEAYMRLIDQTRVQWQNRSHFFAICARLMRRVLVDEARRRGARKRGGDAVVVELDERVVGTEEQVDLVALDEALEGLAEADPRAASVVEMRFFGGLSIDETAAALDLSPATVKREWVAARAWLFRALRPREDS